jgi:hypothetical protein
MKAAEVGSRVRISPRVISPDLQPWIGWAGTVAGTTITPIGFLAHVRVDGLDRPRHVLLIELDRA